MDVLLDKYEELYKQEFVDDETTNSVYLKNYDFKLPIEYTKYNTLNDTTKKDIEFSEENNLFSLLLTNKTPDVSNEQESLLVNKWSSLYTTNTSFLKDSQKLLKSYQSVQPNHIESFAGKYIAFKNEQNFLSKYQYIQFKRMFYLNTVVGFLQFLALYNICSPLLSLFAPLLGLIIPYFVFYFKGIKMSFQQYMQMVKTLILNNAVVKNLIHFRKGTLQQKMYALVYLFFYGMSIYNNVVSCVEFFKNTTFMIELNDKYSTFLQDGGLLIKSVHEKTKSLKHYKDFNRTMLVYQDKIQDMSVAIATLKKEQHKYEKCAKIGLLMKYHFELFYNNDYHDTIMYLIYLNQYNKDMNQLSTLVRTRRLHKCKFLKSSRKSKNTQMKQMYYLAHLREPSKIPNDVIFDKNIMISGPNASGKTTFIKSTIINLFLSQSIGVGCYQKCKTKVYDHFHSYLNIPDTSNRDSLFQAEARRCKNIFEFIKKKKKERHLCIFDEIYSGTNPEDAVLCANIYLNGLNLHKDHVDYVLTTHYLDLCEKYDKDEKCNVKNQQMKVLTKNEDIQYTYTLIDGISHVHGGYQVLQKLDYPDELMEPKN